MNTWPKLSGRFLLIIIWLILISLPIFAFALAARQQIQLGKSGHNQIRIFLIQEKEVEGIGVELTRPFSDTSQCEQTSVRYFMWKGSPENVTFCLCYDPQSGTDFPATPGVCSPP